MFEEGEAMALFAECVNFHHRKNRIVIIQVINENRASYLHWLLTCFAH